MYEKLAIHKYYDRKPKLLLLHDNGIEKTDNKNVCFIYAKTPTTTLITQ